MAPLVRLRPESEGGLVLHRFPALDVEGLDLAVTDRTGGVSDGPFATLNLGDHVGDDPDAVRENRARLAARFDSTELVVIRQVHGARVLDASHVKPGDEADGVLIRPGDPLCAVLVADCVPLVLIEPTQRRLVLVHAGWRGLAGAVLESAWRALDAGPSALVAVGPAISGSSYQVGPEVAEYFADVPAALAPDEGDRSRLDLRAVVTSRLRALGVSEDRLFICEETTDGGDTFFSDRAQRPCGRFAMVAKWRS